MDVARDGPMDAQNCSSSAAPATVSKAFAAAARRCMRCTMRTGLKKPERNMRNAFATLELLWQVLTAKRLELLKALCGAGPASIREAARRVERDVKAVHTDITALLNPGMINLDQSAGIVFPFEAVKVGVLLEAA